MRTLHRLVTAEIIKSKNSFAVWLSLFGTLGNTIIFFLINWFDLGPQQFGNGETDWVVFILNHFEGIAFMMLPLYVIILATLITFMEHRSGTWALIMTLPEQRAMVYLSKFIFGLLLFVAAHVLFVVSLFGSGLLMSLIHPDYSMPLWDFPLWLVIKLAAKTILSVFALLALHCWISLRFNHFIVPLTIGILGFVFTSILSPAFPYQWINPYAYPICYMPFHNGAITLPAWGFWRLHDGMSLAWGFVFIFLGMRTAQNMTFN